MTVIQNNQNIFSENESLENFNLFLEKMWIPNEKLDGCEKILLKDKKDFDLIPKTSGAYWILTDEIVKHSMDLHTRKPNKINGFDIIYNGIAGDLNSRAKEHLYREKCEGQSGISVDLYIETKKISDSHVKYACGKGKKVPYLLEKNGKISCKEDVFLLNLSNEEIEFVKNCNEDYIKFWNGINISWNKHKNFNWYFCYYKSISPLTELIEKKWRNVYGKPRLCSYTTGR